MLKKYSTTFFAFLCTAIFAVQAPNVKAEPPPDVAAESIMTDTLLSLRALRTQNQATLENVEALIRSQFLPHIAIDIAAKLALKDHWDSLNAQQKLLFQNYIYRSLISDYADILTAYDLDSVRIRTNPEATKRQDNRAIVKLLIHFADAEPSAVSLKMIYQSRWLIYDATLSGVSLIKNYRAQFDSHIRRKGLQSLIGKITE